MTGQSSDPLYPAVSGHGRPDFRPPPGAGQGLPPQSPPSAPYGPPPYGSGPPASGAPQPSRPRLRWLTWLVAGLTLLIGTGTAAYLLIREGAIFALDPVTQPTLPSGELPSYPPLPDHPVVDSLTARGLDCVDEVAEPWAVRGCFAWAEERIVTVRMKLTPAGAIDKFSVQVLDGTVSDPVRQREFITLVSLMSEAAELSASDQTALQTEIARGEEGEDLDLAWGSLYLSVGANDVLSMSLTQSDLQGASLPSKPVLPAYGPLKTALETEGYACTDLAESSYECTDTRGDSFWGTQDEEGVQSIHLNFSGPAPSIDHPLVTDLLEIFAEQAGPNAESLRQGLAKMAREQPEQVFAGGYKIARWQHFYVVENVVFV